ncbi:MAG: metal ABC transporter ATP-binding protein [Deltaproteobacteria bacterium]|nr:metal ABC transporter ATP-binding protein [Deltaproteobacteria bacterium]
MTPEHDHQHLPLFQTSGLVVGYRGHPLLPPIDLRVTCGQLWAVVGLNGAGKTTFFRTLLGLQPAVAGTLERLTDPLPMAYIPQRTQFSPLMPMRSWDVVATGLERGTSFLRPSIGRAGRRQIAEALERVDAGELSSQRFGLLSEGQKQRVLIARLLASRPRLAVLDEPTSAMDATTASSTLELMRELASEQDLAVLLISHQVNAVVHVADHTLFLDRATQTVVQGDTDQVYQHPLFNRLYGHVHTSGDDFPPHTHAHAADEQR